MRYEIGFEGKITRIHKGYRSQGLFLPLAFYGVDMSFFKP